MFIGLLFWKKERQRVVDILHHGVVLVNGSVFLARCGVLHCLLPESVEWENLFLFIQHIASCLILQSYVIFSLHLLHKIPLACTFLEKEKLYCFCLTTCN